MRWILAVTMMATGEGRLMGSYESKEACLEARKALFEMRDPKKPIGAGCMREDDRILTIFKR